MSNPAFSVETVVFYSSSHAESTERGLFFFFFFFFSFSLASSCLLTHALATSARGTGKDVCLVIFDEAFFWEADRAAPIIPVTVNGAVLAVSSSMGGDPTLPIYEMCNAKYPDGRPAVRVVDVIRSCDDCAAAGQPCPHMPPRPQSYQSYASSEQAKTLLEAGWPGMFQQELLNQPGTLPESPAFEKLALDRMFDPARAYQKSVNVQFFWVVVDPSKAVGISDYAIASYAFFPAPGENKFVAKHELARIDSLPVCAVCVFLFLLGVRGAAADPKHDDATHEGGGSDLPFGEAATQEFDLVAGRLHEPRGFEGRAAGGVGNGGEFEQISQYPVLGEEQHAHAVVPREEQQEGGLAEDHGSGVHGISQSDEEIAYRASGGRPIAGALFPLSFRSVQGRFVKGGHGIHIERIVCDSFREAGATSAHDAVFRKHFPRVRCGDAAQRGLGEQAGGSSRRWRFGKEQRSGDSEQGGHLVLSKVQQHGGHRFLARGRRLGRRRRSSSG